MYTLNKKQYLNGYQLDKKQQKIVLSNADSILVIAGAGSGKSLTILAKILYLIKNGINPSDILCISFTNAASNNLKTKLKQNGIDMKIYTFHKLGMEILKKDNANINITGDNTLMTIIYNVLKKTNFLEVLPDYDFKDFGTGDFSKMHHLLALETKEFKQLQKLFFTFIV